MVLAQLRHTRGQRAAASIRVRVKGGYDPSVIYGRVGERLLIRFRREETAACSELVVFPAFGMSATLPPFEEVALELLPERAGEFEFTCQMGVLRGKLIVADGASAQPGLAARASGR